ncbi:MAG: toll/interleukin-1 receptor domain-containing protein, partial [Verrucomicrobia bacterium]|nr:toll/interleukin-1 receptor domain-containing protein [Verrucomicrobiota bacterium]
MGGQQSASIAPPHDFPWEMLLRNIAEKRVVPVIGSDLSLLAGDKGHRRRVLDILGERACTTVVKGSQVNGWSGALRVFREARLKRGEMAKALRQAYAALPQTDIPEPLRLLAEISHFDLLVSTATDGLLARAVEIFWNRKPISVEAKLPGDIVDLPKSALVCRHDNDSPPIIYNFFGTLDEDGCFALHEEDVLEFLVRYQEMRPDLLFDYLKQRNLLLVGNSFPDWLARFFVRLLRGQPFSQDRTPWVGLADECSRDKSDQALILFLETFGQDPIVFHQGGAEEFIRELHRRWIIRQQPKSPTTNTSGYEVEEMVPGSIFISYAREDGVAALEVYNALNSKCDTWIDKQRLKGGDPFREKIMQHIEECDL